MSEDTGNQYKSNIAQLIATRPDQEIADEIRKEMMDVLEPVLGVMRKAQQAGLQVGLDLGMTPMGVPVINRINVVKQL